MGNLLQPRADVADGLCGLSLNGQGEEDRLGGIFRIVAILGDAQADAVDHARVAAHDLLERRLRAGRPELLQQFWRALRSEEPGFYHTHLTHKDATQLELLQEVPTPWEQSLNRDRGRELYTVGQPPWASVWLASHISFDSLPAGHRI